MSCVSTANSSSKTNLIIVNQVINNKNNISKITASNYNFLTPNLTNHTLSSSSSSLVGEEEEEEEIEKLTIQEVNTERTKMNDIKSNNNSTTLTINEIATSLNDINANIETSQNESNNETEQLESKQPTIESLSSSLSNKQFNSNESINKRKKKPISNLSNNQQLINLSATDDEQSIENNECKNLEEEVNDEEIINTFELENNNLNNNLNNQIHEFYPENINNEHNSLNDQDFIICGSCQADFKLSNIIDFIDHKIQKCKPANKIFIRNSQKQPLQKSLSNNNSKRFFQSSINKNRPLLINKEADWNNNIQDEIDSNEENKEDNAAPVGSSSPYIYKCSTCGRLFKEVIQLVEHCEIEHNIQICKKFTKTGQTANSNISNSNNNTETVEDFDNYSNENNRNKTNSFSSPASQQRNKLNIQQNFHVKKQQTPSNRLNIQGININNSSNRLNLANNIQQLGNPNKKVKIIHHQQDQQQSLDTGVGIKRFTNTIINTNQNNNINSNKFKNIKLLNGQPATIITNNNLNRPNMNHNNKNNAFNNNQNKTAANLLNKIKAVSNDSQIKREITDNSNLDIIKRNNNTILNNNNKGVEQNSMDEYDENNNDSDDIDNQDDDINNDAIDLDDPDENRIDNSDNNTVSNISNKPGNYYY
jgi:hypothetical protein